MILFLLLLMLSVVQADPTWKWANATKIVEKHEFYLNNEIIVKPQNSWQVLFAVLYQNTNLSTLKDCIFYHVPGKEKGTLKIKTIASESKCEDYLFQPGDLEWKNLKALHYAIQENFLTISMTNENFQVERWDVMIFKKFEHPQPKSLMSSAEYRSPKIIYLTPYRGLLKVHPQIANAQPDNVNCHEISEDCKEKAPSTCSQCVEGWYEIPNGCKQGPKFCGSIDCGQKNQPACRRGMKYQRVEAEYSCRDDHSFAYCMKGLSLQCQGNLPYCI